MVSDAETGRHGGRAHAAAARAASAQGSGYRAAAWAGVGAAPPDAGASRAWPAAVACLLAALCVAVPSVWGATFPDLYTVTLRTEPGETVSRVEAERRTMRRVLTRITGDRAAGDDPELQRLVTNAPDYVDSFATQQGGFRVGFIPADVERQLSALGRPIWGRERPLTLLWIAVDRGMGERAILSEGGASSGTSPEMEETLAAIREDLLEVADERGLPIAFPLLDLEDMSVLGFGDIWGGFDDRVEIASRRYDADAILVGRVLDTELGAEVHWTLLHNGQRSFMIAGSGSDGLHWAADQFAAELSTVGGGTRNVRLTVLDVNSTRDYFRVVSYLEQASVLQNVDVETLENGALSLRVTARGEPGVLERVLSLGGVITAATGAGAGGDAGNGLVFRVARQGMTP